MNYFNKLIKNNLKNLFALLGVFILIVFFQNCGKNNFQTKIPERAELASENTNNSSGLANDDLPEADGINDVAAISSGSASESDPTIAVDNAITSIMATSSTGKVYYVSTSGSNSNSGTSSKPFRTIAYAVSKMVAGDTTYVRGGLYNELLISFGRSGTKSAPIKLLNYPGESPIIDFGLTKYDTTKIHRIQICNGPNCRLAIGWITIDGFEIRNGFNGIKFYNLHDSIIRRNKIHHNYSQGVLGNGGTRNLFDRNVVNHNGDFKGCIDGTHITEGYSICTLQHGLYMHGSYYTITNNLIYDNLAFGIQQNGSGTSYYKSTKHAGPEFAGAANWIIANNTFAYNNYAAGMVVWGTLSNNGRIENNIFYENSVSGKGTSGIAFTGVGMRGVVIRNNLFYASGSGGIRPISSTAVEGVNYTQSGNIFNTLNPRFVNAPASLPSSPNFMLTSSSPAINKGLTTSATKVDFRGVARPRGSAYDIGAYEY